MSLARRVASGTSQLMVSNLAARLLALVTMPILTGLLSPDVYGSAALAVTLISLLSVFALAGVDVSYVRSYQNKNHHNPDAVEAYAWRFALATSAMVALTAWIAWPYLADALGLEGYLILFVVVGIIASVAQTMAQARARLANRYRLLSASVLIAALGAAAAAIAMAWWRRDVMALMTATVLASLIPVIMLGIPPLRCLVRRSGLDSTARSSIFQVGVAAVFSAPAYWVMASSDRWFLGYFVDAGAVGIYSVSYTIAVMGMLVNNAFLPVWTTETIREVETGAGSSSRNLGGVAEQLFAVLLMVWLAVAAAGGDVLRLLAAPEFHAARIIIPLIALAVLFHGVIHIATGLFIVADKLKQTIWWWLGGGILCLVANASLVPEFGIVGAAVTQAVSFGFVAGGLLYRSRRVIRLDLKWARLTAFAGAVLVSGYVLMPAWSEQPLISLLMKAPVGFVVLLIGVRLFGGKRPLGLWKRT